MQQQTGFSGTNGSELAKLYQRYALPLLHSIQRTVPSREDAEDVLVEVFLAVQERSTPMPISEDEQLAWLYRVAHNKCVDLLRRQQRYATIDLDQVTEMLFLSDEHSPESVALRAEEHSLLRAHLTTLPVQQQIILHLKFGQRLKSIEIARQLNKSESSISMILTRALNHLRKLYQVQKGDHRNEER